MLEHETRYGIFEYKLHSVKRIEAYRGNQSLLGIHNKTNWYLGDNATLKYKSFVLFDKLGFCISLC